MGVSKLRAYFADRGVHNIYNPRFPACYFIYFLSIKLASISKMCVYFSFLHILTHTLSFILHNGRHGRVHFDFGNSFKNNAKVHFVRIS